MLRYGIFHLEKLKKKNFPSVKIILNFTSANLHLISTLQKSRFALLKLNTLF